MSLNLSLQHAVNIRIADSDRTVSFFELCPKSNAYLVLTIHLDLDSPHFQCTVPTWGSWHTGSCRETTVVFKFFPEYIPLCEEASLILTPKERQTQVKVIMRHWVEPMPVRDKKEGLIIPRGDMPAGLNACQKFCSHLYIVLIHLIF